jgi:hypothetical protein
VPSPTPPKIVLWVIAAAASTQLPNPELDNVVAWPGLRHVAGDARHDHIVIVPAECDRGMIWNSVPRPPISRLPAERTFTVRLFARCLASGITGATNAHPSLVGWEG